MRSPIRFGPANFGDLRRWAEGEWNRFWAVYRSVGEGSVVACGEKEGVGWSLQAHASLWPNCGGWGSSVKQRRRCGHVFTQRAPGERGTHASRAKTHRFVALKTRNPQCSTQKSIRKFGMPVRAWIGLTLDKLGGAAQTLTTHP